MKKRLDKARNILLQMFKQTVRVLDLDPRVCLVASVLFVYFYYLTTPLGISLRP